jgi:hypothetical protein
MKLYFSFLVILSFAFVSISAAQQAEAPAAPAAATAPSAPPPVKARIFITESQSWEVRGSAGGSNGVFGSSSSGGARPQTAELIKTFGERCPDVMVNNNKDKADFIVLEDHEGGKGLLQHKNKIVVFESISGDTVLSKSTLSLGGAVQDACEAIGKYWAENYAKIQSAKAAAVATPTASAPALAPVSMKPSAVEVAVASTPDGADIEIDGSFVGSTPSSIEIAPGDHAVAIHKKGFKDWERKIKVSGGNINLKADLDPV